MGYLGLDQTPVKEENMLQRLFWPSDHAGETDYLGKQGFWVCWSVAAVSLILLLLQEHWILAVFTFVVYGLGGTGVREHDQPAAVFVAAAFWLNQPAGLLSGKIPSLIWIAAGILLIANIRGTYIAAKWAAKGDLDVFPERSTVSLKDRFVDGMPPRVWPRAKIPFFVLASLYLVLSMSGLVLTLTGFGAPRPHAVTQPPSATLEVSPPR